MNTIYDMYNLHTIFNVIDENVKFDVLNKRAKEQINIAKQWCIKYDMPIKKYYQQEEKEPIIYNKFAEYLKYFPDRAGVNKSHLQMSDIGLYSITPHWEAKDTVELIRSNIKGDLKNMTITEPNGGMGGNTILFSEAFKNVNVVEYSKLHCDILRNNLDVYGCKNTTLYCWDYTDIMKKLTQDVIFMDPPWGGPAYKYIDKLTLHIGKYTVDEILNRVTTKLAVIKAPFNFDIEYFKKHVTNTKSIKVQKIRNYIIIIVKY